MLGEPLVPRRRAVSDESVFDFAQRRIGREAAKVLVDALVTGIWAGNVEDLSLASAFPKLAAIERDHGGLLRGMVAGGPTRGRLTSFPNGLTELTDALAEAVGPRLRLGARVTKIERLPRGGFRLAVDGGPPREAVAVVLACPAWLASPLLANVDGPLAAAVAGIPAVGVAVLHLGFTREEAAGLRGFGFLVPRGESASVLGVSIPSNLFPGRAPDGHVLATVMLGGARDPSAVEATDQELINHACVGARKVRRNSGGAAVRARDTAPARDSPVRARPRRSIGRGRGAASRAPGLFLAGNSYRGIAINSCLAEAPSIAGGVASFLR